LPKLFRLGLPVVFRGRAVPAIGAIPAGYQKDSYHFSSLLERIRGMCEHVDYEFSLEVHIPCNVKEGNALAPVT
ncbi:hypothetical protein, partial [Trueperella pyogenes]